MSAGSLPPPKWSTMGRIAVPFVSRTVTVILAGFFFVEYKERERFRKQQNVRLVGFCSVSYAPKDTKNPRSKREKKKRERESFRFFFKNERRRKKDAQNVQKKRNETKRNINEVKQKIIKTKNKKT